MMRYVTSAQMRAARGLLNWSVRALSERTGVHRNTITNFETGKSGGDPATLDRLINALQIAGVEFIPHNGGAEGVRMKKIKKFQEAMVGGSEKPIVAFAFERNRLPSPPNNGAWTEILDYDERNEANSSGFHMIRNEITNIGYCLCKQK